MKYISYNEYPQAGRFKIIIFLALAAFLAWYSKQSGTNPFKMQSSYYFDGNSVVFFEKNHKTESEKYKISIPLDSATKDISSVFIYGWEITNRNWGLSAKSGDTLIIFSFGNVQDFNNSQILCDVLVSSGDSSKVAEERFFFRPKMTIWYAENKNDKTPAKNIYIPKPNEKFRVMKNRERLSILPIK
ncbi:MAG: hypothetical protein FWF51_05275 [Chitinivibrionia bacterium]|nr:hypothetical protein [Chitinivibrionia bacterium]